MKTVYLIYPVLMFAILSCEPVGTPADDKTEENQRYPSQESWNATILINSEGRKDVKARANYSASYDKPREVFFIGDVYLDFFNLEGEHVSFLKADTGKIDERKKLFTATGNVIVESDSGLTLTTTELFWDEQKERIYTTKKIVFTSETDTLYGVGFESDADLKNWIISKPTGVTYRELDHE